MSKTISDAAGDVLQRECDALIASRGGKELETGEICTTSAGKLHCYMASRVVVAMVAQW